MGSGHNYRVVLTVEKMPFPSALCLSFGCEVSSAMRARISYAFRVFAAIYGYRVVDRGMDGATISCFYGRKTAESAGQERFHIPARYIEMHRRNGHKRFTHYSYAGIKIPLSLGIDPETSRPDWLGELFGWISCSFEQEAKERDSVGRIPYGEMVFEREGLDPQIPYASLIMAWMENSLRAGTAREALPKAPCPVGDADHLVICSHDLDFFYTRKVSAFTRLAKNLAIGLRDFRSAPYIAWNAKRLLGVARGEQVGAYLPELFDRLEEWGFRSTLFVVGAGEHRRDPNYRLRDLQPFLLSAKERGFSVAVHGSYRSCIEEGTLEPEIRALEEATGARARGNRQHWLRFGNHHQLFEIVTGSDLQYDSTLGFVETVGFRNGASFAFPPYDFRKERPYEFLEIPLVIMDGALQSAALSAKTNPQKIADRILNNSRERGWGGISLLWHNPLEPIQVPPAINDVFWNCAGEREKHAERWMSAEEFLACALPRYQNAGLLQKVCRHAT